jgi:uncharacterized protein YndB with AHSA1/START domain
MEDQLLATASTKIKAPLSRVWEALTDPRMIKQYLFGSEVITDWKVGSLITYKGNYNGKAFEDKGYVLEVVPDQLLVTSHWSPLSGTTDSPENYHTVRYELEVVTGGTQVTITQDNVASEEEQEHSSDNWQMALNRMKQLLEA